MMQSVLSNFNFMMPTTPSKEAPTISPMSNQNGSKVTTSVRAQAVVESLAEEVSLIMFGRSFVTSIDKRSVSRDDRSSSTSNSYGLRLSENQPQSEWVASPREPEGESSGDSAESVGSPITRDSPDSPEQQHGNTVQTTLIPLNDQTVESDSVHKKRKSKCSKRRKRLDTALTNGTTSAEDPTLRLPDRILMPTFRKVMSQGLMLSLISSSKRSEMWFWLDGDLLKWGKQKVKERGQLNLDLLSSVQDSGPLELRLESTSGAILEIGASSSVEKSLLMRSFLMVIGGRCRPTQLTPGEAAPN
jgi:hypothetical protein